MTERTGRVLHLRKRELFRWIGYEPHGVQVDMHRSQAPLRVLACGTRFGKSTCAAAEVVASLMQPGDDSLGWVVGPNLEVTNRIIGRVRATFQASFASRIELDNEREHHLIVRNLAGNLSELRGKSAEARASLLGAELDWLVMDECAIIKRPIWEEHLSPRLLDRRGRALLVGTPGGMDWFYELFFRGQDGRDPHCRSWRAPTWDNPHVPREAIEVERQRLPAAVFALQYEARFHLEAPVRCTCCGYPSPEEPRFLFVDTDDQLTYCRVCRQVVNRKGKTQVFRRDDGQLMVLALVSGVPGDGSLPEDDDECDVPWRKAAA